MRLQSLVPEEISTRRWSVTAGILLLLGIVAAWMTRQNPSILGTMVSFLLFFIAAGMLHYAHHH